MVDAETGQSLVGPIFALLLELLTRAFPVFELT